MGTQAAQPERRDWDGLVRREVAVELRVIDQEERSIEVIASTEALDSHGDVIRQHWDLSRYEKNGPVLWNHNLFESSPFSFGGAIRPEDLMPIGKGVDVRVENKRLVAKLVLVKGSPEQEPLVDKLWRRIQQGVVKAVSVGFKPGQITRVLTAQGTTDHFELGSAERPNELREISFVPMGSNPEAVAKSIAWERKHLADESTAAPAAQEGTPPMAMTTEEQKALTDAQAAKTVAETKLTETANQLTHERTKSSRLETELTAEKTLSKKLGEDLEKANAEIAKTKASEAKSVLDGLQGKKFAPSEREELDGMVKDLGLERVQKYLEKRPDITITQQVEGVNRSLGAPPPVDGSTNASADLANEATKGL